MAHFFTADTHFADDPVRRFFDRPFASVEAMDAAMIARAGVVGPDDDLWIIGDFAACETDVGRMAAQAAFAALTRFAISSSNWRRCFLSDSARSSEAASTSASMR